MALDEEKPCEPTRTDCKTLAKPAAPREPGESPPGAAFVSKVISSDTVTGAELELGDAPIARLGVGDTEIVELGD